MALLFRRAFGDISVGADVVAGGGEGEGDDSIAALCVVNEFELAELESDFAFAARRDG
jgi:hypothetical protein